MAKTFPVTVASVGETLFSEEARSVTAPGASGEFTALPHHEPFVSTLKAGTVRIVDGGGEVHEFPVKQGIFETSGATATVLL